MSAALLALNSRVFASLRKHHNYRLFFSGQIISLCGTWMQNVALAWLVYDLTHSAFAVGVLAFCRFAPFTLFGLVSGVLADRVDNRKLVIATQSASMVVASALAVLAFSGSARPWQVFVLAACSGTALVFDAPGRHALTFQMVGRDELPNAIALNASLFNGARVIGPGIAGIIIAAAGVGVCFTVNAVSFLAVLTSLVLMRSGELVRPDRGESRPTVVAGIGEGLAYARRTPQVLTVLAMTAVVSTVGFNFHVLVPVLAADTLHAGPEVFGILSACFGAGALAGALLTASIGRASMKALVAGTAGFSITMLALTPVRSVVPAAILLIVVGVFFTLWTANSQAILQLNAPDHLRGRVLSLYLFAFAGLAPLGGLLTGWLSETGGTRLAFLVAGLTGLGMTGLAVRRLRGQRPAAGSLTAQVQQT